jgi:hypothetical protein
MKRLSKKWFSQIMIHKQLKQEFDELKEHVRIDTHAKHRISYADVIIFLIREYRKSLKVVHPLSHKTLVGAKLKRRNPKIAMPLIKSTTVATKLDGRTRVRFR